MAQAIPVTVRDIDARGKRVLVRVDFNVPMKPGVLEISDDSRVRAALPTIELLRGQGARVVLCSHFGRPRGKVAEELRMEPVRGCLSGLTGTDVVDAGGPSGPGPASAAASLAPGGVALLENLRFDPREEANDAGFSRELASLADVYVNDAFGAAHRAHASTVGVAAHLPAVAGLLMARELEMLGAALESLAHPAVAIIGGAKVSDKISVLSNLLDRVDRVLVGGGMAGAFLAAQERGGRAAGVEDTDVAVARELLDSAGGRLAVPCDVVTADRFAADARAETLPAGEVAAGAFVLDIGPETRRAYAAEIARAHTIIWNGTLGVFEWPAFAAGTVAVAEAVAGNEAATSVVGGGSTAEAVRALGLRERITHVSTGGGASLEFLEGKTLPGVAALDER